MDNRTKILLGVMVLVVGAWVGDQFGLLAFLDGSASSGETESDVVARKTEKAEELIQQGIHVDDALSDFDRFSLPYDTVAAKSQYHDWLTKLVESNSISQSSVDVKIPEVVTVKDADGQQKEAFKRYRFVINGMGRLENVSGFFFGFYRGGHLQKINSFSLTPLAGGRFSMSVSGEALGLPGCDRKSELSSEIGQRLAFDDIGDYAQITRRNVFSREAGATLKWIVLSSVTFDKSGLPEAWFKVGQSQETKRLQRGERIDVSVHSIEVIDVQPRSVLVEVDGTIVDLPIGKSVHDVLSAPELASGVN